MIAPPSNVLAAMPPPIAERVVQVCCATRDHRRTLDHFVRLGIGPWQILTLGPPRITEARYYGKLHSFSVVRCLAFVDGFVWEVIEPLDGANIFRDFLDAHGEGVHHLGMTYRAPDIAAAVAEFESRGYHAAQTGVWDGRLRYAFLATDQAIGPFIEIWEKPDDFVEPAPERWYPE